jgi:hypothetical protein
MNPSGREELSEEKGRNDLERGLPLAVDFIIHLQSVHIGIAAFEVSLWHIGNVR